MLYLVVAGIALVGLGLVFLPRRGMPDRTGRLGIGGFIFEGPAGMVMIVLGVGVGAVGVLNPWAKPPVLTPGGIIESPVDGMKVEQQITVSGRQAAIPSGSITFLLVKIINLDRYFPFAVEVLPDGRWSTRATIGGEEGLCTQYQLVLVMASETSAMKLSAYLATNEFAGIRSSELLTDRGVTILNVASVTRASVLVNNPIGGQPPKVEKCDGPTGDRDLNQYCRLKGFSKGVTLALGVNGGAYHNWQCRSSPSAVDLVDACAFAYRERHVIAALPNSANDPYTWRCYVEPLS